MSDNEFVEAEVEIRGFRSVAREEAFAAWEGGGRRGVRQAIMLTSRVLEIRERVPCGILEDIARWKTASNPDANKLPDRDERYSTGGASIP